MNNIKLLKAQAKLALSMIDPRARPGLENYITALEDRVIELESSQQTRAADSALALDEECFSCKKGEGMPVEFVATQYGYKLCKFHADMGLVAGWDIEPIRAATKV